MFHKDMHPAHKFFRGFLLVCMGLSFCFFVAVVALRVTYHNKEIPTDMRTALFHVDVLQHRAWAFVSDDAQDIEIAERLLRLGFFSSIYSDAGVVLLQEKADEGYRPAEERLAILFPQDYRETPPVQLR